MMSGFAKREREGKGQESRYVQWRRNREEERSISSQSKDTKEEVSEFRYRGREKEVSLVQLLWTGLEGDVSSPFLSLTERREKGQSVVRHKVLRVAPSPFKLDFQLNPKLGKNSETPGP